MHEQIISDATFCSWRSKYVGMDVSDARKLNGLEEEKAESKKLMAQWMLDVTTLNGIVKNF